MRLKDSTKGEYISSNPEGSARSDAYRSARVDISKKDPVRSRLVCQDFEGNDKTDELFAPTPPLVAASWLVSRMASQGRRGPARKRLLAIDSTEAFLYGNMDRDVYIELPPEDARRHNGDVVGHLQKSMYGLRDAPLIWQRVVHEMLSSRGLNRLVTSQCIYYHPVSGIALVAHVDDFLCFGDKSDLMELLGDLQSEFECDGKVLGPEESEERQISYLRRTITLTCDGLEWEGDQKHVNKFLELTGLINSSGVDTPGVKADSYISDGGEMGQKEATEYRGMVALLNFFAQGPVDLSFASKDASKDMSMPREGDLIAVKRAGRYLQRYPRGVVRYDWQSSPGTLMVFSDSDWAGDIETRKSTSGGGVIFGTHLLAHWSMTQQSISLSSCEAELKALCKAGREVLVARHLAQETALILQVEMVTHSSVAKGVLQRRGAGKVKRLGTKQLWLQEREERNEIRRVRVGRSRNWSDLLTHHWNKLEGIQHLTAASFERRGSFCPSLRRSFPEGGRRGVPYFRVDCVLGTVAICSTSKTLLLAGFD